MLAILYLAVLLYFGDCLCRRFYRFSSARQRLATAFLVGLLFSSWITYLGALAFAWTGHALLLGNFVFAGVVALTARFLPRAPASEYLATVLPRPPGEDRWDWLCLGAYFVFGCWLMLATLNYHDGNFEFGFKSWSDFGANLSVAQSFVLGNNFPSEHPFFPGVTLRYHFLFWFQAANLSYLGLNLARSVNLLSVMSLMALLSLLMTFAELLFNSRVVGRIAAALFFFASSSLAYIPFLRAQESVVGALSAISKGTQFLNTGYPYRGEDWGALTVDVFANQRHLISGVGLLFVVLVYLVDRFQFQMEKDVEFEMAHFTIDFPEPLADENAIQENLPPEIAANEADEVLPVAALAREGAEALPEQFVANEGGAINLEFAGTTEASEIPLDNHAESGEVEAATELPSLLEEREPPTEIVSEVPPGKSAPPARIVAPADFWGDIGALLFGGALIGLMPFWNSAVFVAAMLVLGSLFLFFPRRLYMLCLLGAAVLVGLPQILLLKGGNLAATGESLFYFGYTIQDPTLPLVLQYLAWTFGFKWILLTIALLLLSNTQRRFFLALSILLPVVFLLKLSTDVFNNHKLLNLWNIFAAVYVAYALWRIGKASVKRTVLACFLALLMICGAIIELFPIHNDSQMTVPFGNDRLTTWLLQNTQPSDIFLSQTWLTHPVLFTGRKVFLGYTLFAWTAGYNVGEREAIYSRMFEERDPAELIRLLQENKIAYVGIDDGVRSNHLVKSLNEAVYQANFQKVWEDSERRYDNLTLYKVPTSSPGTK